MSDRNLRIGNVEYIGGLPYYPPLSTRVTFTITYGEMTVHEEANIPIPIPLSVISNAITQYNNNLFNPITLTGSEIPINIFKNKEPEMTKKSFMDTIKLMYENNEIKKEEYCCICLDNEPENTYLCGHNCICNDCYEKIEDKKCPLCREISPYIAEWSIKDQEKTEKRQFMKNNKVDINDYIVPELFN